MTLSLVIMINKLNVSAPLETWYKWPQVCHICSRIHGSHKWCSTSLLGGVCCLKQRAGTAYFFQIISAWLLESIYICVSTESRSSVVNSLI